MGRKANFFLILFLLAIGGTLIALMRHIETGMPFLPGQEQLAWQVEARIDFDASGDPVSASLSIPDQQVPGFEMFEEHAASPGYGFSIIQTRGARRAEWTKRAPVGAQSLYYSVQFIQSSFTEAVQQKPATVRNIPEYWDEPLTLAADVVLERARESSSGAISLTRELIKLLNSKNDDQNTALLLSTNDELSELLIQLLGREDIATRSAMGLYLEDARRRQTLTPMVEVWSGKQWVLFNPESGETGVPEDLLLWHRGGVSVLDVNGGSDSSLSFSMIRQSLPATHLANTNSKESFFSAIGVHRLPVEEQSMFKLLLLLPLGAAVVVFMRVIVGIRTAGTFMPILISLAFLQTSLLPGLVSFISVVAIGLLLRGYLSRLNLLLVARIATLIVLVIFVISILSIIGYQMGYATGMTITFFPMIIIAWTIERMSILWEEEGPKEVLLQGGGSLLVAVLAYLMMQSALLKHLTFNFPELNLVLLALILAMGNYTGYRITELRRFRDMEPPH